MRMHTLTHMHTHTYRHAHSIDDRDRQTDRQTHTLTHLVTSLAMGWPHEQQVVEGRHDLQWHTQTHSHDYSHKAHTKTHDKKLILLIIHSYVIIMTQMVMHNGHTLCTVLYSWQLRMLQSLI